MSEFKRIPPDQAQSLREQGAVVVDIRDPQTYALSHISGSQHLDNHSISDFIRGADLDAPLVVVCYHGNSSQSAKTPGPVGRHQPLLRQWRSQCAPSPTFAGRPCDPGV